MADVWGGVSLLGSYKMAACGSHERFAVLRP